MCLNRQNIKISAESKLKKIKLSFIFLTWGREGLDNQCVADLVPNAILGAFKFLILSLSLKQVFLNSMQLIQLICILEVFELLKIFRYIFCIY